jgi:hypothetical protein
MRYFPLLLLLILSGSAAAFADEPPAINPFGSAPEKRDDAVPGYIELSDGKIVAGQVYLTRDARLKINDEKSKRQREVPLSAVKRIDCTVKREWMEKEWKFKELAKDEKMYTGRTYPSREYFHTITLGDNRTISGELSAIVYVRPPEPLAPAPGEARPEARVEKFELHKRDKGEPGRDLKSLLYVKSVLLGKEALEEGLKKIAQQRKAKETAEKSEK